MESKIDIFCKLHESLQYHILKLYMKHHVLREFQENLKPPLCLNCVHHGFPCLNCACYIFKGKLGPGFCDGKRMMISYVEEDEAEYNMLNYILLHGPDVILSN